MATPDNELEDLFRRALPDLGVAADEALVATLARFVRLLHKWNQAFNLTSVREPREMAVRHVLDSLTVRPYLRGDRILDVGSGAGLPGIPLALAEPGRQFCLLDSGIKKVRFVRQAMNELAIRNLVVEHRRIEDYEPMQPFDTVTCRAFTALADFVGRCGRLAGPDGRLVAMKGRYPTDEIAALTAEKSAAWRVSAVDPVHVPGLDAERHIVALTRQPAR